MKKITKKILKISIFGLLILSIYSIAFVDTNHVKATQGDPLTFTAEQDMSTLEIKGWGDWQPINLSYSINGGSTWFDFIAFNSSVQVDSGKKILVRAKDGYTNARISAENYYYYFVMSGKFSVSGDITTLLNKDGIGSSGTVPSYCFNFLFQQCASLTSAANLELYSTNLSEGCYQDLFYNCTSLVSAPALPANSVPKRAYCSMFDGCTALKNAPVLGTDGGVTSVGEESFAQMFKNCSALEVAPALPATTLTNKSYAWMFQNCTSLKKAPDLPATELYDQTYAYMFYGCSSLKTIPNLPATSVRKLTYNYMFASCTGISLVSTANAEYSIAWKLPTINNNGNYGSNIYYKDMFTGCTGGGSFSPSTTYYQKPEGIVLTISGTSVFAGKTYDGTTDALVLSNGTITGGIQGSDNVSIGAVTAVFADKNAGTNKDVIVTYTLSGADKDKYYAPPTTLTANIKKRKVTLTSASANKEYDGTALTSNTVTVTDEGFIDGEGASYSVTGSQTMVGYSQNEFDYTLNPGTATGNYDITTVKNNLTVTPVSTPIIITTATDDKIFDGNPLTAATYTSNANDILAPGDTLSLTMNNDSITLPGTIYNTFNPTSILIRNGSSEDVTSCYTFGTHVIGKLTVDPPPINTLKSPGVTQNGNVFIKPYSSINSIDDCVLDIDYNIFSVQGITNDGAGGIAAGSTFNGIRLQNGATVLTRGTDYQVEKGSVKITLDDAYIRTLGVGTHTIAVTITTTGAHTISYDLRVVVDSPDSGGGGSTSSTSSYKVVKTNTIY